MDLVYKFQIRTYHNTKFFKTQHLDERLMNSDEKTGGSYVDIADKTKLYQEFCRFAHENGMMARLAQHVQIRIAGCAARMLAARIARERALAFGDAGEMPCDLKSEQEGKKDKADDQRQKSKLLCSSK